ncbi:putative disease resistance protein RGA3 [Quercus lobata]|uniref:putative disease resistance protein RGA3 n=1 Tax=Quercus lobata TaxID=97700 RepID=UPI0012472995|nr:putative disease resistance protein RGA3 [Quercus lobata]
MAADALLTDLFKQLTSTIFQLAKEEIKLLGGVDDEVQKLQDKLGFIKAIMDDAEERHAVKQRAEKLWLGKLQDKYYEMDDVLDTWSTARIKIKTLNEKLDGIFNDREKYGIDFNRQPEVVERPITTSFVDESNIIGRDNYREELLSNLLGVGSPKERKPRVISLVGMGGLGKTTLAQIAYNHSEVKAHFDERMWVCVSDPFDQCKVAKAIIQELVPTHESLNNTTSTLQALLRIVCDLIRDKKYFLVFDDVWAKDSIKESEKWEPFKNALTCGAGSKILVTTRNEEVAHMMGSAKTDIINLGNLSVEHCWLIINKMAFSDDYGEQSRDLEELGKQLANKCKGLPLAAKILGSYLRGKMSRKEWEKIINSINLS